MMDDDAVEFPPSETNRSNLVNYWRMEKAMPQADTEWTIRTGMLTVNLETRVVSVNDKPVHLTGKEYRILELLTRRKGTTLTKEMFLDHLYGGLDEPEIKIIDVFICKLRKKLAQATGGTHYIETVWGRGYVLRDQPTNPGLPKTRENSDHVDSPRFQTLQSAADVFTPFATS